jgi:RNA polymerase sigma-70 factor (ECF subfamily)
LALGNRAFEDVLEAAKSGAEWAWETIYRELAGPVMGYLSSRGAADPEDLTSDVFLRVARGIDGFEGDERGFRSWIFVIAHRRLLDERRAIARRPVLGELPADESPEAPAGDVESEALDRLAVAELKRAFDRLTDGQRDVLVLRIVADLSLEETARVLGMPIGAVKSMQRRALQSIRKILDQKGVSR